jgi:hypothetical protein
MCGNVSGLFLPVRNRELYCKPQPTVQHLGKVQWLTKQHQAFINPDALFDNNTRYSSQSINTVEHVINAQPSGGHLWKGQQSKFSFLNNKKLKKTEHIHCLSIQVMTKFKSCPAPLGSFSRYSMYKDDLKFLFRRHFHLETVFYMMRMYRLECK